MKYILNETARFQRFVENKVTYIRNFSDPNSWNYIESKNNPADIISRGSTPEFLMKSSLWNYGPSFLAERRDKIPNPINLAIENDDSELKRTAITNVVLRNDDIIDHLMQSTHSWFKLKTRVAWIIKLKNILLKRESSENVSVTLFDLNNAENVIIRYVQFKYYSEIIEDLFLKTSFIMFPFYLSK